MCVKELLSTYNGEISCVYVNHPKMNASGCYTKEYCLSHMASDVIKSFDVIINIEDNKDIFKIIIERGNYYAERLLRY